MPEPAERPSRPARTVSREAVELQSVAERQPALGDAVALHLDILEMYRRIQGRVPLPWIDVGADGLTRHNAEGRPLLKFEEIPIELTDLRLMVRQTADVLRRHEALEESDYQALQGLGRDMDLLAVVRQWYRSTADRHAPDGGTRSDNPVAADLPDVGVLDQILTLAMRPFLSRCAEVLQQRAALADWAHPYCPLCGSEPDFSVITPSAERHLICGRCTLQWNFEPLTCPYCGNGDRSLVTSFATQDGRYRVYGCDVCRRYLKAYDARGAVRPVMPVVDGVATLPLDAAALQRGYT